MCDIPITILQIFMNELSRYIKKLDFITILSKDIKFNVSFLKKSDIISIRYVLK